MSAPHRSNQHSDGGGNEEEEPYFITDISELPPELREIIGDRSFMFSCCQRGRNCHEAPMGAEAANSASISEVDARVQVPPLLLESSSDEVNHRLIKNFAYRLMKLNFAVKAFFKRARHLTYSKRNIDELTQEEEKLRMASYMKAMCFTQYAAALTEVRNIISDVNFLQRLTSLYKNYGDILELVLENTKAVIEEIRAIGSEEAKKDFNETLRIGVLSEYHILIGPRHFLIFREILYKTYDIMEDYMTMLAYKTKDDRENACLKLQEKIDNRIEKAETIRKLIDHHTNHSLTPPEVEMTEVEIHSILKSEPNEGRETKNVKFGFVEYRDDQREDPLPLTFSVDEFERISEHKKIIHDRYLMEKSPQVAMLTKDYPNEKTVMEE